MRSRSIYAYKHVLDQSHGDEESSYIDDALADVEIERDNPSKVHTILHDLPGIILLLSYVIGGFAISSLMIAAYIRKQDEFTSIMMICILSCSLLTSILSAIALVKYGKLQDQVQRLKEENREYGFETNQLKETKQDLSNEIGDLENENEKLNSYSGELNEGAKEFDHLLDELKGIAKDGEEVLDIVDALNSTFDRMNDLIYENEKAYLLSAYYDAAYCDDDNDMDKKEYNRFLTSISKRFREKFKRLGKFDDLCKGKDSMDLRGFLDVAETVLAQSKELMQEEFMENYNMQKSLYSAQET